MQSHESFFSRYKTCTIIIVVTVIALLAGSAGYFQKTDVHLYDLMLSHRRDPVVRQDVLLVDTGNAGRDIQAAALVRMKELGAAAAVFTGDYSRPAASGMTAESAAEVKAAFESKKEAVAGILSDVSKAVSEKKISAAQYPEVSAHLIPDYINPSFDDLYTTVTGILCRDDDRAFSRSMQFFGNAWLPVGISAFPPDMQGSGDEDMPPRYVFKNITGSVRSSYAAGNPDQYFVSPAPVFMNHARGAGVSTIQSDFDHTCRRIALVQRVSDDGYTAQLVFAPLFQMSGVRACSASPQRLVLSDALFPGTAAPKPITIPLDGQGQMLITWLHNPSSSSFRHASIEDCTRLDVLENAIITGLGKLNTFVLRSDDGSPLPYSEQTAALLTQYSALQEQKKNLLDRCQGYEQSGSVMGSGVTGSDYAAYFLLRSVFFKNTADFISGPGKDQILSRLQDMKADLGDEQFTAVSANVTALFDDVMQNTTRYQQLLSETGKTYAGSFCIMGDLQGPARYRTPSGTGITAAEVQAAVYNMLATGDIIEPINRLYGCLAVCCLLLILTLVTGGRKWWILSLTEFVVIVLTAFLPFYLFFAARVYVPVAAPLFIAVCSFVLNLVMSRAR
jgi:adenylate cyclase